MASSGPTSGSPTAATVSPAAAKGVAAGADSAVGADAGPAAREAANSAASLLEAASDEAANTGAASAVPKASTTPGVSNFSATVFANCFNAASNAERRSNPPRSPPTEAATDGHAAVGRGKFAPAIAGDGGSKALRSKSRERAAVGGGNSGPSTPASATASPIGAPSATPSTATSPPPAAPGAPTASMEAKLLSRATARRPCSARFPASFSASACTSEVSCCNSARKQVPSSRERCCISAASSSTFNNVISRTDRSSSSLMHEPNSKAKPLNSARMSSSNCCSLRWMSKWKPACASGWSPASFEEGLETQDASTFETRSAQSSCWTLASRPSCRKERTSASRRPMVSCWSFTHSHSQATADTQPSAWMEMAAPGSNGAG
mmetsp:Transcript_104172/g.318964  ORF Transcript_104172/g.318964 Transcript_104172/m.318964 type:complete len:379 (-) Transcript_104172:98-1234(-)